MSDVTQQGQTRVDGAAKQVPVTEGYKPYRIFRYKDGDVIAVLRTEIMNGASYAGEDRNHEITVVAQFETGFMKIGGFVNRDGVTRFMDALADATDKDEFRRDHNAALRNRG